LNLPEGAEAIVVLVFLEYLFGIVGQATPDWTLFGR
jgi:hypothetical protein